MGGDPVQLCVVESLSRPGGSITRGFELERGSVAEAVKDRRSLKGLGNRPIRGYDEVMPVFGISFDAPS